MAALWELKMVPFKKIAYVFLLVICRVNGLIAIIEEFCQKLIQETSKLKEYLITILNDQSVKNLVFGTKTKHSEYQLKLR